MATRKLIDLTGAPFIVEKRDDGKFYIVGIKIRKREFIFEGDGLPAELVDKLEGESGNSKIDGIEEIENFLDGQDEGSKLSDIVPSDYVSDEEISDEWENQLRAAQAAAALSSTE